MGTLPACLSMHLLNAWYQQKPKGDVISLGLEPSCEC